MIFLPHNDRTQTRLTELGFKSNCCCIKALTILFPHITTVHPAVNEYPGTDKCGNVNEKSLHSNCSIAECFPEQYKRCWNEQVSQGVLCFGNQIDWFNVFIDTFTVHPSCQRIFDFYEHAVVMKSTSFI